MGKDTGRRIAILLLAGCFALLCGLYMGRDIVRDSFMPGFNMLENKTLSLVHQDGVIRIDGEGKLSQQDLELLLMRDEQGLEKLTDVVIGSGITELGHDVLRSAKALRTLWLGTGLAEVRHGAVSLCPLLQYVYVPAGLRSAGEDFLAECDRAVVVTDGDAEQLKAALDTSRFTVMEGIRSAEAMESALDALLDYSFASGSLLSTDPDAGASPMQLHPGQLQHGPCVTLPAGSYRVTYAGSNLDKLPPYNVDAYSDGSIFPVMDWSIEPNTVQYSTVLGSKTDNVEFRMYNAGQDVLYIDRIDVHRTDLERLPLGAMWWHE